MYCPYITCRTGNDLKSIALASNRLDQQESTRRPQSGQLHPHRRVSFRAPLQTTLSPGGTMCLRGHEVRDPESLSDGVVHCHLPFSFRFTVLYIHSPQEYCMYSVLRSAPLQWRLFSRGLWSSCTCWVGRDRHRHHFTPLGSGHETLGLIAIETAASWAS